jgi:raffinose/stachyose/melibiose transport system permease protein
MSRVESQEIALAPHAATATQAERAHRLSNVFAQVRRNWLLYVLILPTLLFTLLFYYYPMASGIFHSFTYWDIKQTVWVGLDNYIRMFRDPASAAAWRNMLTILIAQLVIAVTFPLFGAALVAHLRPGRGQFAWQVMFILPIVVPAAVIVFVWRWFYGPQGALNQVLSALGLEQFARIWLGDPATALWAIIFVGFPFVAGLNFLIYLAALQSISHDLLDAAKVDGAGPLRTFFQIELPLIRPQIMLIVVLSFIYYLRSFDAPLIMTNGGPGTAGTLVPGLQMYRAVRDELDLGYGSAIGTVLFAVTLIFTLLNFVQSRRTAGREKIQP